MQQLASFYRPTLPVFSLTHFMRYGLHKSHLEGWKVAIREKEKQQKKQAQLLGIGIGMRLGRINRWIETPSDLITDCAGWGRVSLALALAWRHRHHPTCPLSLWFRSYPFESALSLPLSVSIFSCDAICEGKQSNSLWNRIGSNSDFSWIFSFAIWMLSSIFKMQSSFSIFAYFRMK